MEFGKRNVIQRGERMKGDGETAERYGFTSSSLSSQQVGNSVKRKGPGSWVEEGNGA